MEWEENQYERIEVMARVDLVVGAQYGSEGKGAIVSEIANNYNVHIRTGGPNAGHTIYHNGEEFKMQIIPCGWTNPNALLVIGRGTVVNPEILRSEIELIKKYDPNIADRLYVDKYAGVLDQKFHQMENGTNGELHQRIGSTGEGVGAARLARISRDPKNFYFMGDICEQYGIKPYDTVDLINRWYNQGSNILLEGTQGFGLSLYHGEWPYVTSHDTTAAQLLADAGISPRRVKSIIMVARTFPIRVAGNSGPLYGELTWDDISKRVGYSVEEKTTVTKKVRRIGIWDEVLFRRALIVNDPTSIALTFVDYLCPEDLEKTEYSDLSCMSKQFIAHIYQSYRVPVSMVGTGGKPVKIIRTGDVL